ncbi:DUF4097 domain-containing protein [Paenibacillus sediminis]|nr:DUF4097 family beta strand repeat-containing protein [Paenibacillus sediminis]
MPRKRKLIAVLLAALVPGAGHLYLGLFQKGVAFLYASLLDVFLLLYFSSMVMDINVPLLIFLGVINPVLYFYNVYDALQSTDQMNRGNIKKNKLKPLTFGLLLVVGAIILIALYRKPKWLDGWVEQAGVYAVSVIFMAIAGFLVITAIRSRTNKVRIGRYTSSILWFGIGVLLLVDKWRDLDYMQLLLKWWPFIFVVGAMEYIVMHMIYRQPSGKRTMRFNFDIRNILLSVFIAASVFVIAEQELYMHLWNRVSLNLAAAAADFSEESGTRVDKPMITVPIEKNADKLVIDNVNGSVTVRKGAVQEVLVQTTIWVDEIARGEALGIAEQSTVEVGSNKAITISTHGQTYGKTGKRHPRMNLYITIPEYSNLNVDIRTTNGNMIMEHVRAASNIHLETGNGKIKLYHVIGDVTAKTLNGDVYFDGVYGDVNAETKRGSFEASNINGKIALSTLVGNISLVSSNGDIQVHTKNGNIFVDDAKSKLDAESLNGTIEIRTHAVGGDWSVYSAVGEMNLYLPEAGSYRVDGTATYGDITTNLPLTTEHKRLSGKIGNGDYLIQVEGNSDLHVWKY